MAKKLNVKTKVVNAIRRIWFYSPNRAEAKKRSKEGNFYRCEKCRGLHEKVHVDHIIPAVDPIEGWKGYDIFIENMFCGPENLQNLCEACHQKKTAKEKASKKSAKKKEE